MARKQSEAKAAAPAAEPDSAAEELAALSPDVSLDVAGRALTVREYRVFEGLEVSTIGTGFIADIVDACRDNQFTYERVRPLFGKHLDVVLELVARSVRDAGTGDSVGAEWLRGLKRREDMETVLSVWFGVNAGFFVHEAIVVLRQERLREAMARAGTTSSPDSPKADSATSAASDN